MSEKNKPELLGKIVRDTSTNFIGKATMYAITEYGLEQYLVEPKWVAGNSADGRLLEKDRLEIVGECIVKTELSEENRGQIFR